MKAAQVHRIHEEHIRQYYLQRTDQQISQELSISLKSVRSIRKKYGLKRNKWTEDRLKKQVNDIPVNDPESVESTSAKDGGPKSENQ